MRLNNCRDKLSDMICGSNQPDSGSLCCRSPAAGQLPTSENDAGPQKKSLALGRRPENQSEETAAGGRRYWLAPKLFSNLFIFFRFKSEKCRTLSLTYDIGRGQICHFGMAALFLALGSTSSVCRCLIGWVRTSSRPCRSRRPCNC